MKKVFLAISIIASLIAVSCKKEETPCIGEKPEYVEVKIGLSGAISTEVVPFTKSLEEGHVIGIDVYSRQDENSGYILYAHGHFNTDNISIPLIKGNQYKFIARSGEFNNDGWRCFVELGPNGSRAPAYKDPFSNEVLSDWSAVTNTFTLGGNLIFDERVSEFCPAIELYYGEKTDYTPEQGGSVSIDMERMCFGLSINVENFTEGTVSIKSDTFKEIRIEYPNTSLFSFYSMSFIPSFSQNISLVVEIIGNNGETTPIGTASVTAMKNKLLKVNINADASTAENSFILNYSDAPLEEGDTCNIGGGNVIDTPIENN